MAPRRGRRASGDRESPKGALRVSSGFRYTLSSFSSTPLKNTMQLPVENRKGLYVPPFKVLIERSQISTTNLDFNNPRFGRKWMECIDNEWLKELEQKEKEVGNLPE